MDANRVLGAKPARTPQAREDVSPEYFVPDHVFVYVVSGELRAHDGHKDYRLRAKQYCLVRKNHLVRYAPEKGAPEFERVVICFDEPFLRSFQARHRPAASKNCGDEAFVTISKSQLIPGFIRSLEPYYDASGRLQDAFAAVKYEELLLILLQKQPELAGILFDYGPPGKVNLEEFMNRNYIFNISIREFAFLTGRSLSAFKRDFHQLFHETPSRWLVHKRLREAHFLIAKKNRKPADIYLELGFEDLSHFSFAFRKLFGYPPTLLART